MSLIMQRLLRTAVLLGLLAKDNESHSVLPSASEKVRFSLTHGKPLMNTRKNRAFKWLLILAKAT